MYQIHVGVPVTDLNNFMRLMSEYDVRPIIDGDGWNEWGQSVGAETNDKETLHVIIPADTGYDVKKLLMVIPPTKPHTCGEIFAVTLASDWTEVFDLDRFFR